jgi:putative transposase
MDGKSQCLDNIFIERLCRTLKYERLYLMTFDSGIELFQELSSWFLWYNAANPHKALIKRTPDDVLQDYPWKRLPDACNFNNRG